MSTIGLSRASRVELVVKNLLAGRGNLRTEVQSLGREDPLKKSMATRSSIHAWRILKDRGAWWATVHRVAESQTQLSDLAPCVELNTLCCN